ncbi:MAG: heavy metal sensor histidine kinase [Deltaproteobacteria bacterium]|nr:heavy metal sensor histidine kinase [Deltaproteobacteria bacterium]
MFLKNAKGKTTFMSWSITGRLTVLYTVSVFLILVIVSIFLYWVLANNLLTEENEFLGAKIQVLRDILLKTPDDPEIIKEEVQWETSANRFVKYYVRFLNKKGKTMIETPGMDKVINPLFFPSPIAINETVQKSVKCRAMNGSPYLLVSAMAKLGSKGNKQRIVQIALDVSDDYAILAIYRKELLIALFLGTLISAGAGIAIARKGMKPIQEIAKAAQRITATHLHERINPARWPMELTVLASAFDDMLVRLEDSFERLSQFSADLAHELRTPINNLMGETEVTLSKIRTVDDYKQILESSMEEFSRLSRMIDNLLFLARAENPETQIERTNFSAINEVDAVKEFYDALAEEHGVNIACNGDVILNADQNLFRRAISNLISNALKYTGKGGNVTITAQRSDNHYIEIIVKDTGCGIEKEHLSKIFDRFYRVQNTKSLNPRGTGLGLAIVKSIMDMHLGSVNIQSEPGKGTTVVLVFPLPNPDG